MRKEVQLLAVRPRPFPGESTSTYVLRVALANGFHTARHLLEMLQSHHSTAFDDLCIKLRLSTAEKSYLFGALSAAWGQTARPLGLPLSEFNQTYQRWCPACLQADYYLQGVWTLKLCCVCTKHRLWLQDLCHVCGAHRNWNTTATARCSCGAKTADSPYKTACSEAVELTEILVGSCQRSLLMPALSELTPVQVHRAVRYLGSFHSTNQPSRPGQTLNVHDLSVARRLIEGAMSMLSDWPNNFDALLGKIRSSAPPSPSVRKTFSPLYRVVYDDLKEDDFQVIRDAFESYLQEHWWGLICKRNSRLQTTTINNHPRLSLAHMAKGSEVPKSVLRHMVQMDLIDSNSVPLPSGRHARSLHADDLTKIQNITKGAMPLKQAAQELALPEKRIRELITAQILKPLISRQTTPSAASWLIPKEEIENLHLLPTQEASLAGTTSVRDLLKYWRLREGEATALVRALIGQQIPSIGKCSEAIPIGMVQVCDVTTKQWIERCRNTAHEGYSVDQAGKRLGLKQQVTYDLVRIGLLQSQNTGKLGIRIKEEDLSEFRSTYVSLSTLAKELNTSPRSLMARINEAAVCGPSIDGTRQYFYRREGVNS